MVFWKFSKWGCSDEYIHKSLKINFKTNVMIFIKNYFYGNFYNASEYKFYDFEFLFIFTNWQMIILKPL